MSQEEKRIYNTLSKLQKLHSEHIFLIKQHLLTERKQNWETITDSHYTRGQVLSYVMQYEFIRRTVRLTDLNTTSARRLEKWDFDVEFINRICSYGER